MIARVNRFVPFEGSSVTIANPPRAGRLRNRGSFLVRGKILPHKSSRSALRPTQAPVQSVLGAQSREQSGRCVKPFRHIHLGSKLRMSGAVPVLLLYALDRDRFSFYPYQKKIM
jgi:hypothetical protein